MQEGVAAVEAARALLASLQADRRSFMPAPSAFDDIRALFALMPEASQQAMEAVAQRQRRLTKPAGSLGLARRARRLACRVAKQGHADTRPAACRRSLPAITASWRRASPPIPPRSHGQMVMNFSAGGAAINQICATFDLGLKVYELALDMPTGDITQDAGDGRAGLRGNHRLRHGSDRRWPRSADRSARWASATRRSPRPSIMPSTAGGRGLGRPRHWHR